MKTGKKENLILLILLLSSLICFDAMAETEETTVLETMIVNGSGQKSTLLNTNASIHVITAKDIMNSGQTTTKDLISSIPGVINQKSGSKTYFSVRGTKSGMSGGPRIYVDGHPINGGPYDYSSIDSIPLDTIEKIEVIKSPPSSKYGASAGRGVILITTKKGRNSKDAFSGLISSEYGSWDTYKFNAGFRGRSNRVDYSLNAYSMESEGYRHDEQDTKSLDGQIGWSFDGGHINWNTGINRFSNVYANGLTQEQLWLDRTAAIYGTGSMSRADETDDETLNTQLAIDYDKNDWLFNASTGFTRYDHEFENKNSSSSGLYTTEQVDSTYDFAISAGRKFSTGSMSHTLTLGMDYSYTDFDQDQVYPNRDSSTTYVKKKNIEAEKEFLGVNLNHDLSLGIFRFQTGLRYNNVTYKLSNRVPDNLKIEYEHDMDWSLSPSVNILDNANLFVTWNHSNFYHPVSKYTSRMEYDTPGELDPELYDTIEAGWKHQRNKAFNYSFIVYWTQIDDKIASYYVGSTFSGYYNAGTSIHKGVEVEVDGRPLEWLGYRAGFTTIDAEWDSETDLVGKKVREIPEYEYALGIDLFPFRNTRYGSLTIAMDLRGYGEQYEDDNNTLEMPAANFMDIKMTWAFKGFECYLACTNLFDREWEKVVNSSGSSHDSIDDFYPRDGRYIGVGVAYRF